LTTAFEIHWDSASLCEKVATDANQKFLLAPKPHGFTLARVQSNSWICRLACRLRRIINACSLCLRGVARLPVGARGVREVDELVRKSDEALVLLNGGDELALSFPARQLPPRPAGFARDFFLHVAGWDKDADFHVARVGASNHCRSTGWTIKAMII